MKVLIVMAVYISVTFFLVQIVRVVFSMSRKLPLIQPWQNIKPQADFKVLFAGDSTMVGTGAESNRESTSGLYSLDFPASHLENHSQNGLKLKGLIKILESLQDKKFDLAIFQIGGNDIMYFTPLSTVNHDQQQVLQLAKKIAQKIIIFHSGDLGTARLFIWPFSWLMSKRTYQVRDIYLKNQDERVTYIDVCQLNLNKDLSHTYAIDNIHPNKEGYALWYQYIKSHL